MNLRRICSGTAWTICAVTGDRPDPLEPGQFLCDLLDTLDQLKNDARYGRSVVRFHAQLDAIKDDVRGPTILRDNCHHIGKAKVGPAGRQETIWQITANDLRILFFYDEGRLIICSHAFIKRGRKTPAAEQERAARACAQYFDWKVRRRKP